MVQTDALVTDAVENGPFVRVTLFAPALGPALAPGRFVLAALGEYLRTPLFPAYLDVPGPEAGAFDVLVPPNHPAAVLRPGAKADLIGPLGQGFQVPKTTRRLLLVASTDHLPVLLPLTSQSSSVALLISAFTATELYPIRLLPPALEIHVATADGSAGQQGSVLDLFPDLVGWADLVCIAADPAIYPALADVVREVRVGPGHGFAQALIAPPMVCGVGACQGCAVPVARGTKLACIDGPVFDLLELQ